MSALLEIKNLKTYFSDDDYDVKAVDGVFLKIHKGETVALVGESGSGKSITSLSIMRLLPPGGKIIEGEINFKDKNLLDLRERDLMKIRGSDISMIFQEPMTALNPVMKIGEQITEVIRYHLKISKDQANKQAIELLKLVGFSRPQQLLKEYPHRLSGGMRQRIMIAIAMSCNPALLIADEPTTALDVTIQAQILQLMEELTDQFNTSILLITHDLGVVSEIADKVAVMYAGKIVETATVEDLFDEPLHPYTKGLIESVPSIAGEVEPLQAIAGNIPLPNELPKGCNFATRCPFAMDICFNKEPKTYHSNKTHHVSCHLYNDTEGK